MLELLPLLKQLWSVWFTLLFTGIVLWAWWPSRQATLKSYALIPLEDERPVARHPVARPIAHKEP